MLAKLAETLPEGDFLYEPKWDGFRAIVFRSDAEVFIQSRDLRPLNRSESCTFIWHPKVRTSYVRGAAVSVATAPPGRDVAS